MYFCIVFYHTENTYNVTQQIHLTELQQLLDSFQALLSQFPTFPKSMTDEDTAAPMSGAEQQPNCQI